MGQVPQDADLQVTTISLAITVGQIDGAGNGGWGEVAIENVC